MNKTFEKIIFKASEDYFKEMLKINKDASKQIVKAVDKPDFVEAEGIFKEVLRGWWQSYENDYHGGPGVDKSSYQEVFRNLNVNSDRKKPYPVRPQISGFLTEIFVIQFIQQLLGKEKKYVYLHGQPVKFLKMDGKKRAPQPDISIKLGKKYKIIIEVKTNIPSQKDVKRIKEDHEKCKRNGDGVHYYLICAGAEDIDGVNKVVVENLCECDIEAPYWVYMPHDKNGDYEGVKRFKSIVKQIREICG